MANILQFSSCAVAHSIYRIQSVTLSGTLDLELPVVLTTSPLLTKAFKEVVNSMHFLKIYVSIHTSFITFQRLLSIIMSHTITIFHS